MGQQGPDNEVPQGFLGTDWFWIGVGGWSSAVTVPIRYGEGIGGVGKYGMWALPIIFGYATFAPCALLFYYGFAFIAICVIKRFTGLYRHYRGVRQLSGYQGLPLACLLGIPEGLAKQFVEPGMVYLLGSHLKEVDSPLGYFFIAGAFLAALKHLIETGIEMARDIAAGDMELRMRMDAERRKHKRWW